jgi:hypothetical protein
MLTILTASNRVQSKLWLASSTSPSPKLILALRGIEWVKLVFPDVNMLVRVNAEIRDLSLKTMAYASSAVIGTHLIPR